MLKGFDRAKYDLKDPSAWMAIKRDKALHEQALLTVARHLNAHRLPQNRQHVPQILLPPSQQAALDSQVPAVMHSFAQTQLDNPWHVHTAKLLERSKKF
jgi:hypothetical protein